MLKAEKHKCLVTSQRELLLKQLVSIKIKVDLVCNCLDFIKIIPDHLDIGEIKRIFHICGIIQDFA